MATCKKVQAILLYRMEHLVWNSAGYEEIKTIPDSLVRIIAAGTGYS